MGIAGKKDFIENARYKDKVVLNTPFWDAYDCIRTIPSQGSEWRNGVLSENKRAEIYMASAGLYYALMDIEALSDQKTEVRVYTHSPVMVSANSITKKIRMVCEKGAQ